MTKYRNNDNSIFGNNSSTLCVDFNFKTIVGFETIFMFTEYFRFKVK